MVNKCAVTLNKIWISRLQVYRTTLIFFSALLYLPITPIWLFYTYIELLWKECEVILNQVSSSIVIIAEFNEMFLSRACCIFSLLDPIWVILIIHMVPLIKGYAVTLYDVGRSSVKVILDHTEIFFKSIYCSLSPFGIILNINSAFWLLVCSDFVPSQCEDHSRYLYNQVLTSDYFPLA